MATQKQSKTNSNLRDLFAKIPAKKQDPTRELGSGPRDGTCDGTVDEDANPVTKAFMRQLFEALREDLAALRQDLATTVKELKGEVMELAQRVNTMEHTWYRQEEDLDLHRQMIIALQDSNQDLQYRLEDLENRSRRSNIRIRGVLMQATVGPLDRFIIRLFIHVAPAIDDQDIILDRTHWTGHPSQTPSQPQDILTCLHYYKQKEKILTAVRDKNAIHFEGHKLCLFQDLSAQTLQRRHALRPVTTLLQVRCIRYKWVHPFRLQFVWQNELCNINSLAEAEALPGMDLSLRDSYPWETMDSLREDQEPQGNQFDDRRRKPLNHRRERVRKNERTCSECCDTRMANQRRDMEPNSLPVPAVGSP
ncbi:hypothetical protein NDU88_002559 [Pleurodeles waltl]|uniref:Uncharacterized protein n=1 Tax=Pleurodeles waltl TaxID=8319 RepID=A0AAV7KSJ0_PLEWA|nr:hypothetical protein NDU88_002559 [Pleurodeles waltl]